VKVLKENLGLTIPDYPLSNTLTPLICKDNNAKFIFRELKNKYDIFITPNGGNLADRVLRVGHLGYLSIQDNDLLITKLKEVVC
jgi:aspartate aminotransferase-like enzyme